jgi:hypothetical protein
LFVLILCIVIACHNKIFIIFNGIRPNKKEHTSFTTLSYTR